MARRAAIQRKLNLMSLALASTGPDKEPALRRQIQVLLAEDHEVEALIRDTNSGGAVARRLPDFQQISDSIPGDSALLEFHLGSRRSFLWVICQGHLSVFTLPSAGVIQAQAAEVMRLFGSILERRRSPEKQRAFESARRKLSATLLGQLSEVRLPERILIAADGVLHSVPLAALTVPGEARPLGLAHELVRIPAASYLVNGRRPRPLTDFPMTMIAVTDPVFSASDPRLSPDRQRSGTGLPRLPYTDDVRTASSLIPSARRRVLGGFDATPATLQAAHLADYAIIHFSTHAVVDHEIPEMSRIALTLVDRNGQPVDGFLRPYELAQWDLDRSLVVLAACETARGKHVLGEGVIGLVSSLLYAGASQLIATVAPIDDEAAAKFFDHVYSRLLGSPSVGAAQAVTSARRAIAASPRWADPYYWATFVVIGGPGTETY
jgi:CHAT domain-containing protein